MKKSMKIVYMMLVFISMIFLLQNVVLATNTTGWDPSNELTSAETWGSTSTANSSLVTSTQNVVGAAIKIIRIVGTGMAIIMLTYVAIKYMSAAPNEKAEFKKSATAMIVGAVVLFAASNILQIIADFATTNITT